MHPQIRNIQNYRPQMPHCTPFSYLVLAGVLSTILMVGADCLLEIKPARAGVIENSDRHADPTLPTDLEFSNFPSSTDANSALEDLELASTVELELAPNSSPTLQTGESLNLDVSTLEFSSASSVPASSPLQAEAPSDSIHPSPQTPESQAPESGTQLTDRGSSSAITNLQPAPPQFVSDLRDANVGEVRSSELGVPLVHAQAAYILQDSESSARLRLTGVYPVTPNLLFGATVDLTAGNGFTDSSDVGFDLNELYFTVSPATLPNLRFTAGMIDLTSYFDRNSFAKDSVTQFFNPVFQTNPALAATGIGSRPGALVSWDVTDNLNVRATAFSSSRDLGNFAIDGFAGEIGLRLGNLIVRGTYATDRDAGQRNGFQEIFQIARGGNDFGLRSGDREEALGINAEFFIPELNLGLFGRYGHYENLAIDRGGNTYSFGFNLLDLFMSDDRLGLAYGRQLSNDDLRQSGSKIPDVLELFYDFRISSNLRGGVTVQERDGFSDTVLGIRVRADFDIK